VRKPKSAPIRGRRNERPNKKPGPSKKTRRILSTIKKEAPLQKDRKRGEGKADLEKGREKGILPIKSGT